MLGQLLVPPEDLVAERAGNDPALVFGLYVLLEVVCLGVSLLALVAVVVELHRRLILLQLALSAHVDLKVEFPIFLIYCTDSKKSFTDNILPVTSNSSKIAL